MLIPGVSGGTVAIYLGVYNNIIDCVANFKKNIKNNLFFLFKLLIGAALSVIILSKPTSLFVNKNKEQICIIVGLIFVYLSIDKIINNRHLFRTKDIIFTTIGFVFPVSIFIIPKNLLIITSLWQVFLVSYILSLCLILPGISFSYCLFVFGIYQKVIQSIIDFDITFIAVFLFGLLLGVISFTKLIDSFVKNNTDNFNCCINGFVLFSSIEIIPINYIIKNYDSIFYILISLLILFLIKNFSKNKE